MADNNIDIEQLQRALNEFTNAIQGTTNTMTPLEKEMAAQKKALSDYKAALKKAQEEQYESWKKVSGGMTSYTKQAMDGAGSFGVLNTAVDLSVKVLGGLASAIPVVGGAFKAMGEAAGDVTKMMIDQFQTGWNAYKDLQDVGLVKSFEDLQATSLSTGLMFQDLNKAVGKYSTDMANFGGSVGGGMKKFKELAGALEPVRKDFNALGIGAAEFNEYQAKYMAQETRLGRARNQDLSAGTKAYIEELDTLSKLTGLSRKDLQAQRDAALSETKFGAAMSLMTKETQESFHRMNSYMTAKGGPALAQGIRDLTSGAVSSDAAKQMMLATGGKAGEIIDQMKSGAITAEAGFEAIRKSIDPKKMAEYAQYTGDASLAAKDFAQFQKLFNSTAPSAQDIKDIETERKKNLDGTNKGTKALANTEQQLYDTSKNLQNLMTSSTIVTKGMDGMSDALDELSVKMLEMSGAAIPADLKARMDERKAIREVEAAKEKEKTLDDALIKQQQRTIALQEEINKESDPRKKKQLERQLQASKREEEFLGGDHAKEAKAKAREAVTAAEKKAEDATQSRKKISGKTAAETRSEQSSTQMPQAPAARATKTGTGDLDGLTIKEGDVHQEGNKIDPKLIELAKKVQAELPGFSYFSGFNDKFHNENAKSSEHTKGLAMDFALQKPPTPEEGKKITDMLKGWGASNVIDEYNFPSSKATAGHIHAQISARDGFEGVLDGPESGYKPDVTMHGKEQMTITPEKSKNDELLIAVVERLDTMAKKYDSIIDLLDDGNDHSKKLVQAMA